MVQFNQVYPLTLAITWTYIVSFLSLFSSLQYIRSAHSTGAHWDGQPIPELSLQNSPPQTLSMALRIIKFLLSLTPSSFKARLYDSLINTFICSRASPYHRVYRLPFGLVLKVTQRLRIGTTNVEADALRFVNNLDHAVHCPQFIDAVLTDTNKTYLLSTWIHGDLAAVVWDDLSSQDKAHLIGDLRERFCRLRLQTSGSHIICNASNAPVEDPRIPWFSDTNPQTLVTSQEFSMVVWHGLNFKRNQTLKAFMMPLIDRPDIPVTFCHGDLMPRNLIFPGGLEHWRLGHSRIGIIDWEFAVWMPCYWDPLKATCMTDPDDEWFQMARLIFPEDVTCLDVDWEWRSRSGVQLV